jgi:hypothetical protein
LPGGGGQRPSRRTAEKIEELAPLHVASTEWDLPHFQEHVLRGSVFVRKSDKLVYFFAGIVAELAYRAEQLLG